MTWRLRLKAAPSAVSEWPEAVLRQMLQAGLVGEQHEFSPPGEDQWLSAFQALLRMNAPGAAPVTPSHDAAPESRAGSPRHSSEHFAPPQDMAPKPETTEVLIPPAPADSMNVDHPHSTGATPLSVTTLSDTAPIEQTRPVERRVDPPPAPTVVRGSASPSPARSSAPSLSSEARADASAAASRFTPVAKKRRAGSSDLDEEDELEMTPMIDMTFLLLIFFMVTSSITAMANLQLPESQTGRAEETEDRVVLVVDFPGQLEGNDTKSLNGSKFIVLSDAVLYFLDDPERRFPADQLDTELRDAFAKKPGSRFILEANRKMPVGVVRQILKSAAAAGARETLVGVTMPR